MMMTFHFFVRPLGLGWIESDGFSHGRDAETRHVLTVSGDVRQTLFFVFGEFVVRRHAERISICLN